MTLIECADCHWTYPENLLNKLFISSGSKSGYSPPICGICALQKTNEFHGFKRKKFNGEIAEHMRQLAIRWRKKNPHHKSS